MKRKIGLFLGGILALGLVIGISLPSILGSLGLHPAWEGETHQLPGKRALIVTTSHGILNAPGETEGPATGVAASELTHPYYDFLAAGMDVDVASIEGGPIPIDPQTIGFPTASPEDKRALEDPVFRVKIERSLPIADVDFTDYDAIFLAGGWGAAYDLGTSDVLAEKITEAYYANRAILGGVCHGPLGFIRAKDREGNLLITGRRMTGVTDKQVRELGIELTPLHPETELRRAGVQFESETAFQDVFATHVVVDEEERFVTGQNQNSGHETAHTMMKILAERS